MIDYTAYEVLKEILESWDISDLQYFDFYKDNYIVKYGRKDYIYEIKMSNSEFYNLITIIKIMGLETWIEIYD